MCNVGFAVQVVSKRSILLVARAMSFLRRGTTCVYNLAAPRAVCWQKASEQACKQCRQRLAKSNKTRLDQSSLKARLFQRWVADTCNQRPCAILHTQFFTPQNHRCIPLLVPHSCCGDSTT